MKPLGATIGLGSAQKCVLEVAAGRRAKRGLCGGLRHTSGETTPHFEFEAAGTPELLFRGPLMC